MTKTYSSFRLTLSQFWSFKFRRKTFLNYIKFEIRGSPDLEALTL